MHLHDFPALDTSTIQPFDMGTFNTGFSYNDANGVTQNVIGDTFSLTPGTTYGQIYNPSTQYSYINNLPAYSDRPLTPITMTSPPIAPAAPATNTAPSTPAPPATQQVTNTQPQPAASGGSSADWFARNITPLLAAGIQTYGAVKQYDYAAQMAAARLPAGVSSNYLTAKAPTLTAAQIASMTPAQLQAYYAAYPSANPNLYSSLYPSTGSGILSSLGLGSMDTTTMLMLAGGGLLLFMMMRKEPAPSPARKRKR